ncbi:MAG TPA: DUF4446 family protein [Patescibacteria group bacterium]|nr:DUF4446 family protein [Patescibacteria group bacterium]
MAEVFLFMFQNLALFIILGVWLTILSLVFGWFFLKLNKLVKNTQEKSFIGAIEKIVGLEKENKKEISELDKRIVNIVSDNLAHVQKMGLVRFNPFEETGGDHSFSIALLNGNNTGVVITGLHTRERTRLYVKSIKRGKSEYELSLEEQKALVKAQKE